MKLKDRLENKDKTNIISINENSYNGNFLDISDIFDNDDKVKNIITDLLNKNKNIILAGDKSIDKQIAANYILIVSKLEDAVFIDKADDVLLNSDSKIYIMSQHSIKDMVKIFEYIIRGYKSFIIALDLKNFAGFIEKLKALIAVNFPNMTEQNTDTLLAESDLVFVSISVNQDGLYTISQINELVFEQGAFDFKVLFEKNENDNIEMAFDNIKNSVGVPSDTEIQIFDETVQNNKEENAVVSSPENIKTDNEEVIPVKKNKYKLLKEKIKNKKSV